MSAQATVGQQYWQIENGCLWGAVDRHLENPLTVLNEETSHGLSGTGDLKEGYQITECCTVFWLHLARP